MPASTVCGSARAPPTCALTPVCNGVHTCHCSDVFTVSCRRSERGMPSSDIAAARHCVSVANTAVQHSRLGACALGYACDLSRRPCQCDGTSLSCPSLGVVSASSHTVCRAAAGVCDAPEVALRSVRSCADARNADVRWRVWRVPCRRLSQRDDGVSRVGGRVRRRRDVHRPIQVRVGVIARV
jgi:hypothetical protein